MEHLAEMVLIFAMMLPNFFEVCEAQQYACVSDCDPSGTILALSDSGSECCAIAGAGGFEVLNSCQSCNDFQALTATLSTSATPSPPMLGQPLSADCTITTPASLGATANITWFGPDGNVAANGAITNPSAMLSLPFSPFTASDLGEYTCSAEVTSPMIPGVTTSVQGTLTFSGSAQPLTITESNPPVAGSPYTLTCTETGTAGSLDWIGPDGMPITTGGGVTVTPAMTSGGVTTSVVSFTSVSLDDSGPYRCTSGGTSTTTTRTVDVGLPPVDFETPTSMPPMVGQPYPITCGASTLPLPADLTATLFSPGGDQLATAMGTGTITAVYTDPDFQSSDYGEYRCVVVASSPGLSRNLTSNINIPLDAPSTGSGDNCGTDPSICSPDADCVLVAEDVFECVCRTGFEGDGVNCTDVNECANGNEVCDSDREDCTNTPGSFECDCKDGFDRLTILDRNLCLDINECRANTDNCSRNAICRNTRGGFTCRCRRGFEGDGYTCCPVESSTSSSSDSSRSTTKATTRSTTKSTTTRTLRSKRSRSSRSRSSTSETDSENEPEVIIDDGCPVTVEEESSSSTTRSTPKSRSTTRSRSSTTRSRSTTTRSRSTSRSTNGTMTSTSI